MRRVKQSLCVTSAPPLRLCGEKDANNTKV